MTQQNGQEFIEIQEAADELGVTRKTLEKHAKDRGMTKYRRGLRNQVFYTREDIDRLKAWLYTIRPEEE
jgi:hypothetical protein